MGVKINRERLKLPEFYSVFFAQITFCVLSIPSLPWARYQGPLCPIHIRRETHENSDFLRHFARRIVLSLC
jgi:hypothetical protein